MDDAGSGGFCLSLVNGVGPAVAMAPYAARMLPRLLLWLEPSSWTLNSNRACGSCEGATTWELWWYPTTPSRVASRNQQTFR